MKIMEYAFLFTGIALFIFSGIIMVVLLKRKEPFLKYIWLMVLAFLMMGFSAISNAEVFGLFKYEKEKKIGELELLANALKYCPDNEEIKEQLNQRVEDFTKTESISSVKDKEVLSEAYFSLQEEDKAISYAKEVLLEDKNNEKAKAVKQFVETEKLIQKLPQKNNKRKVIEQRKVDLKALKANPNISKQRVIKLERQLAERQIKSNYKKQ